MGGADSLRGGKHALLLRVLLLLVLCVCALTVRAQDPVRIGILAFRGVETTVGEWAPMIDYLNKSLPGRSFELLRLDHDGLHQAVAERTVSFVITNPGHYVELEAEFGLSRILTLAGGNAPASDRAIGSAVIVRADRTELATLADLRGRRLAIIGREGFGGYQIVWRELKAIGIDPDADLAALHTVGLPMDKVIAAVERGEADGGVVRSCLLESLPRASERFRVLSPRDLADFPCATTTRLYPDWPIAALRHTPPELARALAIALLSVPSDGHVPAWSVPADYQTVHELFRELQIGPYDYLREPTLMALANRYWPWLMALAAALAVWVVYTVHVEHQVHVRTAALRAALAEREALEARMRANQEQADHLARLSVLGELSGTLAHELNQPLASIGNYASSLGLRADNGRLTEAAVREAASEIVGQAERAAAILGRIRAFARKRAAQREQIAPGKLAAEAVALFSGVLANAPPVELIDKLAPGRTIAVDPLQIQQVLLNLLKNGYDAARELPAERRKLVLQIDQSGAELRFEVRDFGPGLEAEAAVRLFEPFFTTKPDGLGLGLAICTTIAEAHGGRLGARPADPGPGMIFTLSLPDHD